MKTFFQFIAARHGFWKPQIGEVYRPDRKEPPPDPFGIRKPAPRVRVLDVRQGFVKFVYADFPEHPQSSQLTNFAAYYVRVKP